ncbi:MAG: hypothetical protein ABI811_19930 [Acidobacteriota bacterium]
MRTLAILFISGALLAQSPAYEKVASAKDLMHLMVIPASEALFNVGAKEPANDKDWQDLRTQALMLAESGNLMLIPGRATAPVTASKGKAATKGKAPVALAVPADWAAASRQMRAAGKSAVAAIDKKDLDMLLGDVGEAILTSCSSCHDKYLLK